MKERRFFVLDGTVHAAEIESFMCRVVAFKTLPLVKCAPSNSPGTATVNRPPPHSSHDIIPGILPKPSLSANRREFLQVVRGREVGAKLSSFFGLNLARGTEEKRTLESKLVKRYVLPNPEQYFQRLMENEYYARDVRALLDTTHLHRAYLITGFLTTEGTSWKTETGEKHTNSVELVAPLTGLNPVGVVPGLLDFRLGPTVTTSFQQNSDAYIADEEIFAVSYSTVKLAYSISRDRSAGTITKTVKVGAPKRAKAHHLALGHPDDSDEEIQVQSDDEEDCIRAKSRPSWVEGDVTIIIVEDEDEEVFCDDDQGSVLHMDSLWTTVG